MNCLLWTRLATARRRMPALIGALGLVACFAFAKEASAQRTRLFFEDFEKLKLGPSVDEANFAEDVWTNVPPQGWTIRNDIPEFDNPDIGMTEWKGWSFPLWDWWITADTQRREEFQEGEGGIVAVADPDEWDDRGDPDSFGMYNTWLKTPAISLAGVGANSLEFNFDSSWRDEAFDDHPEFDNNQTAIIYASFDGAAPIEVMHWDSDDQDLWDGDYHHDDNPNEEVSFKINNPAGAKSVVLEFALLYAENDWWWAIDNLELTGNKTGVAGDFDGSGALDAADIDQLSASVRAGGTNPAKFDLTGDNKVDAADRDAWVNTSRKTYYGDADLNGEFNSGDFVAVFGAGEYEDATAGNSGWAEGDWDGNGDFDSGDFVAAFAAGGYEIGPRAAVSAVPEPSSCVLLALGGLMMIRRRR